MPIPDLFSLLPFQFAEVLFADPAAGAALAHRRGRLQRHGGPTEFFIGNARRLGTAGKILFPIPNRRLAKRLYRVIAPVLIVWGGADRYIDPRYSEVWNALLETSTVIRFPDAGHMVPFEQARELADAICEFVATH